MSMEMDFWGDLEMFKIRKDRNNVIWEKNEYY